MVKRKNKMEDKYRLEQWMENCFFPKEKLNHVTASEFARGLKYFLVNSGSLIKKYSLEDISRGLHYIFVDSKFFSPIYLEEVSTDLYVDCFRSIKYLYKNIFQELCSDYYSHLGEGPEKKKVINSVCYSLWNAGWMKRHNPIISLDVMEFALNLKSLACIESALLGLSIYKQYYPEEVEKIIRDYIESSEYITPELCEYAYRAQGGFDNIRKTTASQLLREIKDAFMSVTLEGGVSLHQTEVLDDYGSEERMAEARLQDTDKHWWEVKDEWLDDFNLTIGFLDSKGLHYYLPAYMSAYVRNNGNIEKSWELLCEFQSKLDSLDLSRNQKKVIKKFLIYARDYTNNFEEATDVLQYWENFEHGTFSAPAFKLWSNISEEAQNQLKKNVWCEHCQKTTEIVDFYGSKKKNNLILNGKCLICYREIMKSIATSKFSNDVN